MWAQGPCSPLIGLEKEEEDRATAPGLWGRGPQGPSPSREAAWLGCKKHTLFRPQLRTHPRPASENLPGATGTAGAPHPQTFVYFEQKKPTVHKIKQQQPREMGFERQSYFERNQMLGNNSASPSQAPQERGLTVFGNPSGCPQLACLSQRFLTRSRFL